MDIKVDNSNNMIVESKESGGSSYEDSEGFTIYTDVPSFKVGGLYDGSTYTAPSAPTLPKWKEAFKLAREELIGLDPKGIESGTESWMKCVRYNAMEHLTSGCKETIVLAYGL